jgi:hypothetical protein
MLSIRNFMKSPLTTLAGAVTGLLQAGVMGAVTQYSQTPGQVFDWKPYAAAGAVGMATFVLGGLLGDKKPKEATENLLGGQVTPAGIGESTPKLNPMVEEAIQKAAIEYVMQMIAKQKKE